MRPMRTALKFRMELAANHEWMIFHFDDLRQARLWPNAGKQEAVLLQVFLEDIIEFIAMAMALVDLLLSIRLCCMRTGNQFASERS